MAMAQRRIQLAAQVTALYARTTVSSAFGCAGEAGMFQEPPSLCVSAKLQGPQTRVRSVTQSELGVAFMARTKRVGQLRAISVTYRVHYACGKAGKHFLRTSPSKVQAESLTQSKASAGRTCTVHFLHNYAYRAGHFWPTRGPRGQVRCCSASDLTLLQRLMQCFSCCITSTLERLTADIGVRKPRGHCKTSRLGAQGSACLTRWSAPLESSSAQLPR